jgi:hypothetical protein
VDGYLDLDGYPPAALGVQFARAAQAEEAVVIATLRRARARYHNLELAIADGFVLVHPFDLSAERGTSATCNVRSSDGYAPPDVVEWRFSPASTSGLPDVVDSSVQESWGGSLWLAAR